MPGFFFEKLDGRSTGPVKAKSSSPTQCQGCLFGELRRLSLARESCIFVIGAAVGAIIAIGMVLA